MLSDCKSRLISKSAAKMQSPAANESKEIKIFNTNSTHHCSFFYSWPVAPDNNGGNEG